MVPKGWEIKKLQDIYKIIDSLHQTPKFSDSGLPMVRVTDVKGGLLDLSNTVKVSDEVFAEYTKKYQPKQHDIVFSRVGSYGISAYAATNERFCLGQNTVVAESNDSADSKYIFNVLKSSFVKRQIERTVDGSSHKTVSLKIIRNLDIPVPPLPEQQKIAKILSTWDKAISTTERLIENSTQQKKALMQQLLTGKKRLLDESGKRFEGEWESKLFKNILKLDRGSSPRPIVQYMTDSEDGVNWIKIGDTKGEGLYINSTKEKITKEGATKSRKVSKGEVVLSNSMSYGKPYILNIDGYIHDGWFVIRNFEENIDVSFLIQILSSELIQKQYKRLAAGGVVSNISSELVYAVKVSLPSIPEQQKIATVLTNADREIELLEQQLAGLQQEKKALMQVLLTGKKRVVDEEG